METENNDFDNNVDYHEGMVLRVPDALSRLFYPPNTQECRQIDNNILAIESSPAALEQRLR